jgi:starch-binding outer membrane protein, SusD/RagB family
MKMKNIFVYIAVLVGFIATSCEDNYLETVPTTQASGESMFSTATAALTPLNGIYRMMYTQGWSTLANTQQCDGLTAWNLMGDVMGEDMVMKAQGSGWYWYDCIYNVKSRYTSSGWRSYDLWNGYYTLISNANYIIAAKDKMGGLAEEKNYVIGQAYAIRAYSYHYLAMMFSRTYIGHESEPGIPLYTEPTSAGTDGKPRSTLLETYKLIRADIDTAINRLKNAPTQTHKTHIDYYVANGIKARICLTTNEWAEAEAAAHIARQNYTIGTGTALTSGMNDRTKSNVMWAAEIIDTQTPGWGPFLYHMDALSMLPGTQSYAYRAPKCINSLLYAKMGTKDVRKAWWNPNQTANPAAPYLQIKFRFSDPVKGLGDKLWMRVEEMYLTEAEALCRQAGKETAARNLLIEYMKTRDADYTTAKTGTSLGALTTDETGSLLEEILIQRRIELWGEYGRVYDIKRLKQGFKRTAAMGWTSSALISGTDTQDPETYAWVLTIPQAEFDGNKNLTFATDQNPLTDHK